MKRLFQKQQDDETFRKELDERGVIGLEETTAEDRKPSKSGNLNAFLGKGTSFTGTLAFEGTVRIDGSFEGEVITKDTLVIAEGALVKAKIRAGSVVIGGTMHGDIIAARNVELNEKACLVGNISTPSLSMAEGVIFEGSCTMGKKADAAPVISREKAGAVKVS